MENGKFEMRNEKFSSWSDPKRKRGTGIDLFPFELF
jgi:hypothetical protein